MKQLTMKRIITYILMAIFALQLSGCGSDEKEPSSPPDSENVVEASAVMELGGRDNSLNAYSAAVNVPLRVEEPEDVIGGIGKIFLGASRAYYFKKHVFGEVDKCWDELAFVTAEGEAGSEHFDRQNQVWDIGPVAGTNHYVTLDAEEQKSGEEYRYFLTERDENHGPLREIPLNFLDGCGFGEAITSLTSFAVDYSGAVHLQVYLEGRWQYLLVSPTGETLAEYDLEKDSRIEGLVPLYDGRIALWMSKWDNAGGIVQNTLQYMDAETGRPVLLAALDAQDKLIYGWTLLDENTLLYADNEGVYCSGLSGDNPKLLYCWSDHGITVWGVDAMQADREGRAALIYKDSGNDKHYLWLEPTTEEVEILRITLAVSSHNREAYQRMATEFNRQYPSCHIDLKDGYDMTALLTELAAGKGPVLVDTTLTGFEEQEKLWEPLDTVMGQLGIAEELHPSALEAGRINGTLYGVVTDFRLRTLATGDPGIEDWDYDAFLQCIEDRPELEAIFDFYGGNYGSYFIVGFLSHGLDDAYFLDAGEGKTGFGSSEFHRALELAGKYCVREEGVSPGASMLEGKVLCNELSISRPEELAAYRICYGEKAHYIGYPTKDGAQYFLEMGRPLAIRRTATEEEKAAAAAFISLCLSYEAQTQASKDLNFGLSVRRDVLEGQIAAMNDEYMETYVKGFGDVRLGDDLDIELDRETMLDMIDRARPMKNFPAELRAIIYEELNNYFSGTITEDMLIDHLENRVGLYLEERK